MPVIMVFVMMLIFMIFLHMRRMLILKLIAQINIVIDSVVIDGGGTKPSMRIKIEGQIDIIGTLRIQRDITHLITTGGQMLTVHE